MAMCMCGQFNHVGGVCPNCSRPARLGGGRAGIVAGDVLDRLASNPSAPVALYAGVAAVLASTMAATLGFFGVPPIILAIAVPACAAALILGVRAMRRASADEGRRGASAAKWAVICGVTGIALSAAAVVGYVHRVDADRSARKAIEVDATFMRQEFERKAAEERQRFAQEAERQRQEVLRRQQEQQRRFDEDARRMQQQFQQRLVR